MALISVLTGWPEFKKIASDLELFSPLPHNDAFLRTKDI